METETRPVRLFQCPSCWSFGMHKTPRGDQYIECDCGEQMRCVDLRGEYVHAMLAMPDGSFIDPIEDRRR